MSRQVRDNRLSTRDARAKLPPTRTPLWHEIHRGLHLGYRKGRRTGAGHWHLREYRGGKIWQRLLGVADDLIDADGIDWLRDTADRARRFVERMPITRTDMEWLAKQMWAPTREQDPPTR